jgi:hypothetical protein
VNGWMKTLLQAAPSVERVYFFVSRPTYRIVVYLVETRQVVLQNYKLMYLSIVKLYTSKLQ